MKKEEITNKIVEASKIGDLITDNSILFSNMKQIFSLATIQYN